MGILIYALYTVEFFNTVELMSRPVRFQNVWSYLNSVIVNQVVHRCGNNWSSQATSQSWKWDEFNTQLPRVGNDNICTNVGVNIIKVMVSCTWLPSTIISINTTLQTTSEWSSLEPSFSSSSLHRPYPSAFPSANLSSYLFFHPA